MPPAKSNQKKQADRLFSELIRSRGRCEFCGERYQLECAHIFRRGLLSTRWDEDNALCLCLLCHRYYTEHPTEWWERIETLMGDAALQELRERSRMIARVDYDVLLVRLSSRLTQVKFQ